MRKQADALAKELAGLNIDVDAVSIYRLAGAGLVTYLGHGQVPDPYGKPRVNFTCSLLGGAFGTVDHAYAVPTPGASDPLLCEDGKVSGRVATDCVWLDDTFGNVLVLDVPPARARQLERAFRTVAERS